MGAACSTCYNHREKAAEPFKQDDGALARCVQLGQCPAGHTLLHFVTNHSRYFCNGCLAGLDEGALVMACRQCKFDVCPSCFQAACSGPPDAPKRRSTADYDDAIEGCDTLPREEEREEEEEEDRSNSDAEREEEEDLAAELEGAGEVTVDAAAKDARTRRGSQQDIEELQRKDAEAKAKVEAAGRGGRKRLSLSEMSDEMAAVMVATRGAREAAQRRQRAASDLAGEQRRENLRQQKAKTQPKGVLGEEAQEQEQLAQEEKLCRMADLELATALRVPIPLSAGSVDLGPGAEVAMKRVLAVLVMVPRLKIVIHCHSCVAAAQRARGMRLCQRRGQAVIAALRKLGATNPLEIEAWADSHPEVGPRVLIRMTSLICEQE